MITRFKFDKDSVAVDFSILTKACRIETTDTPSNDLMEARTDIVKAALVLFGLQNIQASLTCIELTEGKHSGSKLLLNVPLITGDYAKIQCPSVSDSEQTDYQTGQRKDSPHNDYNAAVEAFMKRAEEFVCGERQQLALPLEAVDAMEPRAVADRIVNFSNH